MVLNVVILVVNILVFKGRVNTAEAQKPGWQGGIAIRKVFVRPESFCAQPLKLHWEVSEPFGKFPDGLDIFRIVWKVSG